MHVVFDLDGVLFDTREQVTAAYRNAGVEMPDYAWSKPWREWLPGVCNGDLDEAFIRHENKNKHYLDDIAANGLTPLAGYEVFNILRNQPRIATVGVLTGASRVAVDEIFKYYRWDRDAVTLYGAGMTQRSKLDTLLNLNRHGIYVDDNPFEVPGWRVVKHEKIEDVESLMEKLWMP